MAVMVAEETEISVDDINHNKKRVFKTLVFVFKPAMV